MVGRLRWRWPIWLTRLSMNLKLIQTIQTQSNVWVFEGFLLLAQYDIIFALAYLWMLGLDNILHLQRVNVNVRPSFLCLKFMTIIRVCKESYDDQRNTNYIFRRRVSDTLVPRKASELQRKATVKALAR